MTWFSVFKAVLAFGGRIDGVVGVDKILRLIIRIDDLQGRSIGKNIEREWRSETVDIRYLGATPKMVYCRYALILSKLIGLSTQARDLTDSVILFAAHFAIMSRGLGL